MDLGLKGCRALVAGASKGLGKACALSLAKEGAKVFICSRNLTDIESTAAEIGAVGFAAADVSRAEDVQRLVAQAIDTLGGLDILVTNAGGPPTGPFDIVGDGEQSRQHFVTTFLEHLNGVDFEKRETVRIRDRYDASVPTVVGAVSRQKPVFVEDAKFLRINYKIIIFNKNNHILSDF
jgi:NAD(P)-dependent dehydrogenase (short-subunit alcohol dehydrogenase family)